MASKRELIDTGTDKRYVRRDEKGRFTDVDVSKSLSQDRRKKAKTVALKVQGDQGRDTFTIKLSSERASKLQELAREAGTSPEDLLQTQVESWLSQPEAVFEEAARYVLKKNAELYRRLA
ncbi:MAG TPA: hypothetical protein VHC97_09020 [Thermoanaerobaculia bacterium]|jgi:uncharacterized protein YbaP (TraB family)|nr:hypothetical protein [Thermoanaerobaculia bacterium]